MKSVMDQFINEAASLREFLEDEFITDILINGTESLYVERKGELLPQKNPFSSEEKLRELIECFLTPLRMSLDATRPWVDGVLLDGTRFHVILNSLTSIGPCISLRKFQQNKEITLNEFGNEEELRWIHHAINSKKTLFVCGATGSGKSTFIAKYLEEVPSSERILLIEEARELSINHPHVVALQARCASADGKGEVSLSDLIRNALRMRPDRIVVGECRGREAFSLLQALNTGHRGSCFTLHANGVRQALTRLESLVSLEAKGVDLRAIRQWISQAIGAGIFLERRGRSRKITEIIEILGLEGTEYRIGPISGL